MEKSNKKKKNMMWYVLAGVAAVGAYLYMKNQSAAASSAVTAAPDMGTNSPSTTYGSGGDYSGMENQLQTLSSQIGALQNGTGATTASTSPQATAAITPLVATPTTTPTPTAPLVNTQNYVVTTAGGTAGNPNLVVATNQAAGYQSYTFASQSGSDVTVTATQAQSNAMAHGVYYEGILAAGGVYQDGVHYSPAQYAANGYQLAGIAQSVAKTSSTAKPTIKAPARIAPTVAPAKAAPKVTKAAPVKAAPKVTTVARAPVATAAKQTTKFRPVAG